jgi:integral membrane sensor domain MASE1
VNKYVLAAIARLNEAVALLAVEPLRLACRQNTFHFCRVARFSTFNLVCFEAQDLGVKAMMSASK